MKKYIIFLALAISGLISFSQTNYSTIGRQASTGIGNADKTNIAYFVNPSYTQKVWRSGVTSKGRLILPIGYSIPYWRIINVITRDTVATGSGYEVSWTPSLDLANKVVFDLYITSYKALSPKIDQFFYGEITVLPPVFTESQADVVLDFTAGQLNYQDARTPRSAIRRVFVKGDYIGANNFQVLWATHTDATKPLHVLFSPGKQVTLSTTNAFCARIGTDVQNVVIDGAGSELVRYGLKLSKTGSAGVQAIYIEGADASSTLANASKNLVVTGIDVEANNLASSITLQNTNSAAVNYDTYKFEGFVLKNIRINNSVDESFYMGHFTDAIIGGTFAFAGIDKGLFYDLIGLNPGRENFQIGSCFNCKVFKNYFENAGGLNDVNHQNEVQFSSGNQNMDFYSNTIRNATRNVFSGFTGRRGSNAEFHANTVYSTGHDSDGQNMFARIDQNDTYSTLNWAFYNNSIQVGNDLMFELWNDAGSPTTVFDKLVIADNLFVSGNSTTVYHTNNGINTTNFLITNNQMVTDVNTFQYFNQSARDYRLGSKNSPAFTSRTTFTKNSPYADFDFNGVRYMASNPAIGAYSGHELFAQGTKYKTITSVASVSDITVPNGTLFSATGLPSTIQVNMDDGSNRYISVTWNAGSYNATVAATYAVTGTLTIPSDVLNPSALQAAANVIVSAPLSPTAFKVNFYTGTASGWESTGSTDPNPGIDYGQLGTTGVSLRSISPGWNTVFTTGATTGSNTGIFPDAVLATGWYVSGTSIGKFELSGTPLDSRNFNIVIVGTRGGIAGPRTTQYRINGGSWQTLNTAANTANSVTFTGIQAVSGKITVEVQNTTPSDAAFGYINGMTVTSY